MISIRIIRSHRDDKYYHMAISSEGLIIALHGISKDTITDDDLVMQMKYNLHWKRVSIDQNS